MMRRIGFAACLRQYCCHLLSLRLTEAVLAGSSGCGERSQADTQKGRPPPSPANSKPATPPPSSPTYKWWHVPDKRIEQARDICSSVPVVSSRALIVQVVDWLTEKQTAVAISSRKMPQFVPKEGSYGPANDTLKVAQQLIMEKCGCQFNSIPDVVDGSLQDSSVSFGEEAEVASQQSHVLKDETTST
eukprot:5252887-Amphidinium_carterae.1